MQFSTLVRNFFIFEKMRTQTKHYFIGLDVMKRGLTRTDAVLNSHTQLLPLWIFVPG